VFNCVHGTAPRYLQDVIQPVAEVTSRRRLRSADCIVAALVVPATRRSSLGDSRTLAVAGSRTIYLSSSPTDRHLSPSRNISRLFIQFIFLDHESDY